MRVIVRLVPDAIGDPDRGYWTMPPTDHNWPESVGFRETVYCDGNNVVWIPDAFVYTTCRSDAESAGNENENWVE